MKQLRVIRIILALLFLIASIGCIIMGREAGSVLAIAERSQIILSALSISLGATLVWLLASFLFGRIYCSTVCPVGTVCDIFLRFRRFLPAGMRPAFKYRHRSKISVHLMWLYILCIVIGPVSIPFLIEPWNIMRNIVTVFHPDAASATWISVGLGAGTGIVAGVVSLLLLGGVSLWRGREFCSRFCPVGTAMGLLGDQTVYHIEIDPDKCISCGHCEEVCRSQCVKSLSRFVDNARCVRCFDCVAECPTGAIRFQPNRNRPASPLMKRAKT